MNHCISFHVLIHPLYPRANTFSVNIFSKKKKSKLFKSSHFSFWFGSHMKQKNSDNYFFTIKSVLLQKIAFLFLLGYLCRIQSNKILGYWHCDFFVRITTEGQSARRSNSTFRIWNTVCVVLYSDWMIKRFLPC